MVCPPGMSDSGTKFLYVITCTLNESVTPDNVNLSFPIELAEKLDHENLARTIVGFTVLGAPAPQVSDSDWVEPNPDADGVTVGVQVAVAVPAL